MDLEKNHLRNIEQTLHQVSHRLARLEERTEKRQRPKTKVVNTHRSMVEKVYNRKCPCCMNLLEDPEIDHFSSRAWGGLHDTWLICGRCNRDLYHGRLVRAEILPRFVTYQAHLKRFLGGEQMTLLTNKRFVFYANELASQGR